MKDNDSQRSRLRSATGAVSILVLFGLLGLTMLFVLLQALYIARHIQEQDTTPEES